MNRIHSTVWSKVHNSMVVASELTRSAGKGRTARAQTSTQRSALGAVALAMVLGGGASTAQAVVVDANGATATLNATDTYTKITASNGGTVDAAGNAVTISGANPGVNVNDQVSSVDINGATLILDNGGILENTDAGAVGWSHALTVQGANGQATLKDVAIKTAGLNSFGIRALDSATVIMSGGSINTTGQNGFGAVAGGDAQLEMTGVHINTTGIGAGGISVSADAQLTVTGGSITAGAKGVSLTGGVTTIEQTDIKATGNNIESNGIWALSDAWLKMTGGSVETMGDGASAINVQHTAEVTLENVDVLTSGAVVSTGGGLRYASGIKADNNAQVTMAGGSIKTTGQRAYGIEANSDSIFDLTNVEIKTTGVDSFGIFARNNSTVTLTGTSITTDNDSARAVYLRDDSDITLTDVALSTSGSAAHGIDIGYGVGVTMTGGSITTTGLGAGLSMTGNGNSVELDGVMMDTNSRSIDAVGITDSTTILIKDSDLTRNNGDLMFLTGVTGDLTLHLTDGTRAVGDIRANGGRATLRLDGGSQWTGGRFRELRGDLILSGAGTATHGGTVADPIRVSGDVTVNDGASLGGNLLVYGALTGDKIVFRPGNSIGTQTFASAGSFADSAYHAEIDATGASDKIIVTAGNFDLTGIDLFVGEADGVGGYKLDHDYTIVQTGDATGISGIVNNEFANGGALEGSLAGSLVTLDPVMYGDDDVKIRLSMDRSKLPVLTRNQKALVDAAVASNPAVQKAVQTADYADALNHLSGEIHAGTQTALLDTGNLMQRTVSNRIRGNAGSPACAGTAGPTQDKVNPATGCSLDYPLWAQVVGNWNRHDGDSNTASTRYRMGGLYIGGDKAFDNGWRVGGAVGLTDGEVRADARDSRADIKSYTVALYGGKSWALSKGQLNLMMGGGFTHYDIDTDRKTNVLGSQTLKADYDGYSTQLFTELGYAIPVSDAAYVEPYLNLDWTKLHTSGFAESGGSTALRADSASNQMFTQTLGLRGGTVFSADQTDVRLLAGLGWRHANGDLDAPRTMSFRQGGGDRFSIQGAPIAKNAAVLDLGAEAQVGKNTALGLSYSGQFSNRGDDNSGTLYLRVKF